MWLICFSFASEILLFAAMRYRLSPFLIVYVEGLELVVTAFLTDELDARLEERELLLLLRELELELITLLEELLVLVAVETLAELDEVELLALLLLLLFFACLCFFTFALLMAMLVLLELEAADFLLPWLPNVAKTKMHAAASSNTPKNWTKTLRACRLCSTWSIRSMRRFTPRFGAPVAAERMICTRSR